MLVLALPDTRAELDQVVVRVDDRSLDGLRCSSVVSAIVEGDPSASVLVALPDLRPTHATTHLLNQPHSLDVSHSEVRVHDSDSKCSLLIREAPDAAFISFEEDVGFVSEASRGDEPVTGCPVVGVLHRYNAGLGSVKGPGVVWGQHLNAKPAESRLTPRNFVCGRTPQLGRILGRPRSFETTRALGLSPRASREPDRFAERGLQSSHASTRRAVLG